MSKPTFIFYVDWYNYIEEDIEQEDLRMRLYQAIPRYAFTGEEPKDPAMRIVFGFIRRQLDRDAEKYEAKIEKRREAGRKGAEKTNAKRWGQQEPTDAEIGEKASANADKSQQMPKKSRQTSAKSAVNNNGNANTNVNEISLNGDLDLKSSAKAKDSSQSADSDTSVSYEKLVSYWNQLVEKKAMPKLTGIKEGSNRRKLVAARIKEYGKAAFAEAMRKAAESTFLNGGNRNGQIYGFDWIIKPNNFPKVLEGNYTDVQDTAEADFKHFEEEERKKPKREDSQEAFEAWAREKGLNPTEEDTISQYLHFRAMN